MTLTDIRPSPIAGTWYPGDPEVLAGTIDAFLERAAVEPPDGKILGVLAPHAGHRYSGQVAAYAFRCLQGLAPQVVAILSPSHYPYPGQVLTTMHEAYGTPLGPVAVQRELLERVEGKLAERNIECARIYRDQEHALEIELPFLQRVLSEPFTLLPLMLRDQGRDVAEAVGAALADVLADRNAVIIASSDLSHYYPAAIARRLDAAVLARVEAFDPVGVLEAEEKGIGFACGRGAIAAMLWAARGLGANEVRTLHYATSGDVTGDDSAVVGYGAAVVYQASDT